MVDQHDADVANIVYVREGETETTRQVLERDVAQIEDAMKRKAEGLYGICEDCRDQDPRGPAAGDARGDPMCRMPAQTRGGPSQIRARRSQCRYTLGPGRVAEERVPCWHFKTAGRSY